MPLSLIPRFCADVYVIHCHGRIVVGDEEKFSKRRSTWERVKFRGWCSA